MFDPVFSFQYPACPTNHAVSIYPEATVSHLTSLGQLYLHFYFYLDIQHPLKIKGAH